MQNGVTAAVTNQLPNFRCSAPNVYRAARHAAISLKFNIFKWGLQPTLATFHLIASWNYHLRCHLASGEGIVTLGVCVCVCVSAELQLHAALVSAAKVMHCIQCSRDKLVKVLGSLVDCVFCTTAIDLTYGVVLCFGCHDYVYCDEVDTIAQSQRQLAGTSLGT